MTPSAFYCPRCARAPLELEEAGWLCPRCQGCFPNLAGIPCLVPDPALWRSRLLGELDDYLGATGRRLHQVAEESRQPSLLPRTRERLLHMIRALGSERARMQHFVDRLTEGVLRAPPSAIPGSAERTSELRLLNCYENVFRDWAWGARENELARAIVSRLALQPLGELVVLGAGAARLSVDVHQTLAPTQTFALDNNALPLLIAQQLLQGARLELHEFPVAPHDAEHVAVQHALSGPTRLREGMQLVFADALRPPFPAASFDSVLTPWFIDVVEADLPETATLINFLLRPGGSWLNFGPLRFTGSLSRMLSIQEVHEVVRQSGFEIVDEFNETIPYFDSPYSGSRRLETVFCFSARKVEDVERRPSVGREPPWVCNPNLPIPALPEFASLRRRSVFTTGILGMIDGTRSISDLAISLGRSWGVPAESVQGPLRSFLSRLS